MQTPMATEAHSLPKTKGFSLVEVAMALGIFAFAIAPVIGLMNLGLNVSKESIDASAMSQIFRRAEAAAMTSGTALYTSGTTLYFTNYGDEVTTAPHSNAVYQAVISGTTATDDAQGLFARRVLEIHVRRASPQNTSVCKKVLELTMDPADMPNYFQ